MLLGSEHKLHSEPAANLADCGPKCGPDRDFALFEQGPFWPKSLFLFGSPGRIRTSDQPVNSRLLYH
jgi:hypothetical protein